MRPSTHLVLGIGTAVAIVAAGPVEARRDPARFDGSFDGSWGIEVATEAGACDPLYRYYVVIDDGLVRLRSMSGQLGAPAGRIRAGGRIDGRIGQATDPVAITGRLAASSGRGTWTAPARGCSGHWTAAKRG